MLGMSKENNPERVWIHAPVAVRNTRFVSFILSMKEMSKIALTGRSGRELSGSRGPCVIDQALNKFAFADPNSYTVHFRVRIGTDGKITPIAPPTGNWQTPKLQPPYTAQDIKDFAKNGPPALSKIQNWVQEKLLKIQPCPFPQGTRVPSVERTPSIYHNVPGHTGQTPSPVPVEPR